MVQLFHILIGSLEWDKFNQFFFLPTSSKWTHSTRNCGNRNVGLTVKQINLKKSFIYKYKSSTLTPFVKPRVQNGQKIDQKSLWSIQKRPKKFTEKLSLPHPPILGAFIKMNKIFCLLILNRLFLNNVKVESFALFTKNTLCGQMHQKCGDSELRVCPSIKWSKNELFKQARTELLLQYDCSNVYDWQVKFFTSSGLLVH